jgi:hypothetical protein
MIVYVVWENSPVGGSAILSVHRTPGGAEGARDNYPGPTPQIDEREVDE